MDRRKASLTLNYTAPSNANKTIRDHKHASLTRQLSLYKPLETFILDKEKHYQQQYADIYFLRLTKLKPAVEAIAAEAWDTFSIAGESVERVERVLDVRQGKLCWVAGTIYMDMPLKPNILEDISKDVGLLPSRVSVQAHANMDLCSIGFPRLHLRKNTFRYRARMTK